MADKRYTAIFEAQDRMSDKLKRIEQATTRARDAQGRFISATKRAEDAQERMKHQTDRATSSLDRMRRAVLVAGRGMETLGHRGSTAVRTLGSGLKGVVGTLTSLPSLIAGAGAAFGAWKLGDLIVGGGLRQEMTLTQLQGLAGSAQKGNELYGMLREMASNSTFSNMDYTQATRSYLGFSTEESELRDMLDTTKKLALLDPVQGFDGASFALKEAMSGDLLSLSERFELPKSFLRNNGFDSSGSYLTNLQAVEKTLEQMGMDDAAVKKFESTGMAQLTEFKNKSIDWLGQMGSGVVKEMKPFFNELNQFFQSPNAKNFAKDMSTSLGGAFNDALTYVQNMNLTWQDFERVFEGAGDIFGGVGDSFAIMMGTFDGEKSKSPREQFEQFAESIEAGGKAIRDFNESFAPFVDKVRGFTEWGTTFFQRDEDGNKQKGLLRWAGDALTGKGTDWYYTPGEQATPWQLLKETFKDIDNFIDFNPNAKTNGRLRGSHMGGLSNVPYDGYVAKLHKDERVLTAQENREYGRGGGFTIHIQNMHVRKDSDINEIGKAIANELRLKGAM